MKKAISLFVAILIVMATVAVPVATAETGTRSTTQSTCTTCGTQTANCGAANVTITKLSGEESNKAISSALKNEQVIYLRQELINEGYTPKTNNAEAAYRITTINGSVISETVGVVIPFNPHDNGGNATIVHTETTGKITVEAIIQEGKVTTLFKDGSRYQTGPASVLSEPLDILKMNSTYNEVATNLSQAGAIVREDLATVKINQSSNVAGIIIPVENGSGFIAAEIDLINKKVISVVDPSTWDCIYGCMPDWLKGVCSGSCIVCADTLNLAACLVCAACGCGAGYCVGQCIPSLCGESCLMCWLPPFNPAACCICSGC